MCRFTAVMAVNLEYYDQKILAGTNEKAQTDFLCIFKTDFSAEWIQYVKMGIQ